MSHFFSAAAYCASCVLYEKVDECEIRDVARIDFSGAMTREEQNRAFMVRLCQVLDAVD